MSKLTLSLVKKLSGGEDVRQIQRLDASNKSIVEVNDLSPCLELLRLDLSHNDITSVDGIIHCAALTWLDLSHNRLDSLVGLRGLVNLAVLRASYNSITACGDLSPLSNLKALILSHNQLSCLQGLSSLGQLNTLVLSHNQFESVSVEKLSQLSKLSVSHNLLRAVPNTQSNLELRELRLNDNKLWSLPESLPCNTRLKILDLGNNRLKDANVLEPLRTLGQLGNLNLKGNRLCEKAGYLEEIVELLPSLSILDGRRMEALQPRGEGHREEDKKRGRTGPALAVTTATVDIDSGRRQKKRERTEGAVETDREGVSAAPLESEFDVRIKRKKKHKAEEAMEEDGISGCQKTHKCSLVKSVDCSDSASVSSKRGRGKEEGTLTGTCRRTQQTELESGVAVSDSSSAVFKSVSFATEEDCVSLPLGEGGVRESGSGGGRERKPVDDRRKGLKNSLKGLAKGRSGVVAVREVRKRRGKRRESGGWDPAAAAAGGSEALQIGSGQSSTWT